MQTGTEGITSRQATPADSETLVALYSAFFAEDGITVAPEKLRANLAQMLADPRAAIVVASNGDIVIGLASASLTHGVEFGRAAEFEDLYVAPEWRGRGVSHALVDAIIAWAEQEQAAIIALVITELAQSEQGLTAFYERHGFEQTDRITMYKVLQPNS